MTRRPTIEIATHKELRARRGKKWQAYSSDILPAWVADMDIKTAPFVRRSLLAALDTGDLGYPPISEMSGVPEAFSAWCSRRWGWSLSPESIHLVPEVVAGIDNCIETLTEFGDAIMVQTPSYPPLMSSVRNLGRRLVLNELGPDVVDIERMRDQIEAEKVRMLLLCNPHNPTGRIFSRTELRGIAEIVERCDVLVVSDEVHADLAFPSSSRRHIPFASLDAGLAARTITFNSASKAFNIAGLRLAVCAVENAKLRKRLFTLPTHRWSAYSTLGVHATLAAWVDEGEEWLDALLEHLEGVRDHVAEAVRQCLPDISFTPPMASYLAWFDCRALQLPKPAFEFFLDRARVGLSRGEDFGPPGVGHVRMNFGTSHEIAGEIIDRMGRAITAYRRRHV